jgi:hypothetical protein
MGGDHAVEELPVPLDDGTYCMRCRERRPLADARRVLLRNGRPVLKGRCPVCDAPLFRIAARVRRSS